MSFDPMRAPPSSALSIEVPATSTAEQGATSATAHGTYHTQSSAAAPASYGLTNPKDSPDPKVRVSASFSQAMKTPSNWVALLWLTTGNFAWGVAAFCWAITTVSVGFGVFIIFPVGPALLLFFALSWRAMAYIELMLSNRWSEGASTTPMHKLMMVVPKFSERTGSLWTDFWALFGTTLTRPETWVSLFYFALLKFTTALFNFVLLVTMSAISLAAITNPIVLVSCSVCYGGDKPDRNNHFPYNNGFTEFLFISVAGQFFLVPLGFAMLWVTVYVAGKLARVDAELANRLLVAPAERKLTQRLSTGEVV